MKMARQMFLCGTILFSVISSINGVNLNNDDRYVIEMCFF